MGKSRKWVRNAWKQVLEREDISEDMNLQLNISNLIEDLKEKIACDTQIIQDDNSEETKEARGSRFEPKMEKGSVKQSTNLVANEREANNAVGDISERKKNIIIRTTLSNMKTHSKGKIL